MLCTEGIEAICYFCFLLARDLCHCIRMLLQWINSSPPRKQKQQEEKEEKENPDAQPERKKFWSSLKKYMFWPCTSILASQFPNVRASAQKVEEFLKQLLTHSVAEMCFKANSEREKECTFASVCSEGSSRICWSPLKLAILFHVIKGRCKFSLLL